MRKFVLHPGDGVSFTQLVECYGLTPEECHNVDKIPYTLRTHPALIHLFPLNNGEYKETLQHILELRAKEQ